MNNEEWERREFLLRGMRVARRQLRYCADEIDAIGIMLSSGGITIQDAIEWMDCLGLTGYVAELSVRLLSPDVDGDGAEVPEEEP